MKTLENSIENEVLCKICLEEKKVFLENEMKSISFTRIFILLLLFIPFEIFHLDQNDISSQISSIEIDSSYSFNNELSQSIEQIRDKYQFVIDHQRNHLHQQFHIEKRFFQLNLIQIKKRKEQSNKYHRMISQTKEKISHLKTQNQYLNDQIKHFQFLIQSTSFISPFLNLSFEFCFDLDEEKRNEELNEMKEYLNRLDEQYSQIITTKFSLEEQINTYRQLLQGLIILFYISIFFISSRSTWSAISY